MILPHVVHLHVHEGDYRLQLQASMHVHVLEAASERAEPDDQTVDQSVGPVGWEAEADRLLRRVAGRFARVETRRRVRGFMYGLLADLPRKNCWSIAEHAGDRGPHGMQHLLARAGGTPIGCATTSPSTAATRT